MSGRLWWATLKFHIGIKVRRIARNLSSLFDKVLSCTDYKRCRRVRQNAKPTVILELNLDFRKLRTVSPEKTAFWRMSQWEEGGVECFFHDSYFTDFKIRVQCVILLKNFFLRDNSELFKASGYECFWLLYDDTWRC